ncbi:MAG TPA: thioredoxin family protein [Bacteroidales bacterium]|nr:thioredoxin family protein [Bacteroidales bacterium]
MNRNLLRPILIVAFILTILPGWSQNRSINFVDKPWNDILTMAKSGKKMIFLDGYASWCGPCKWMAANMFTNDSIADLYNRTFICAHFDMEKGEGLTLAQLYQIKAYPTLLFLNPDGEMVHKRVGAPQKVSEYFEMETIAQTPGEGFSACVKKFNEGDRDPAFIKKYMQRLQEAYMPADEPLNQYFSGISESEMSSRTSWDLIFRYVTDIDSKAFNWFVTHREDFARLYTRDSVFAKLDNVYIQALTGKLRNRNFTEQDYEALKKRIRESGYPGAEKVIFTGDLNLFQMKGDIGGFLRAAAVGIDTWYADDPAMLERMAATFLHVTSEKDQLEKAAGWAKKSVGMAPSPSNHDVYAQLLFKMGNRKEAEKFEQMAIDLARQSNLPTKDYEATLQRFRQ